MTRDDFEKEYLIDAFFWVNRENHINIQFVLCDFGFRPHTGSGSIKWHEGFRNLVTFPADGKRPFKYYQKVDMYLPNARYGQPKNMDKLFKDFELLKH